LQGRAAVPFIEKPDVKKQLEFEKVGDINSDFPYLCVYLKGENDPFMEIGISRAQAIEFIFYPGQKKLLSFSQWTEVAERARVFLKAEIANQAFE
jgi:hypothetical protein